MMRESNLGSAPFSVAATGSASSVFPAKSEGFVAAQEVAAYLKLTRRQILEMTRRGIIPGYALGTGTNRRVWRYKLSEVDAIVTARSKKALEPAFRRSAMSSKISSGSPRSQKGNSNG
jgi:excisionase family DNA binding protein